MKKLAQTKTKTEEVKITPEEAESLIGFINAIQAAKLKLAGVILEKHRIIDEIKSIEKEYNEYDKLISHKYGHGVRVDLSTRVVTTQAKN